MDLRHVQRLLDGTRAVRALPQGAAGERGVLDFAGVHRQKARSGTIDVS